MNALKSTYRVMNAVMPSECFLDDNMPVPTPTDNLKKHLAGVDAETLDGWYIIRPPAERGGADECAFVRLDTEKQEYVLDVVGQERKYSEELKRYQGWLFWPVAWPNGGGQTRAELALSKSKPQ